MEEKIIMKGRMGGAKLPQVFWIIAGLAVIVGNPIVWPKDFVIWFPIFCGAVFFGILGLVTYLWISKCEICVSDKRVFGKAAFGKHVDLPLDSISAVGSGWPRGIAVATSSGRVAFLGIKNYDEIHRCISNLLIERQSKATPVTTIKQEIPQSNADELKKYKDLLDSGVISQEEFDTKKKQLLGL